MRVFNVFTLQDRQVREGTDWPTQMPANGFVWVALERTAFEATLPDIQSALQRLCGSALVDLHVSDLLNPQLPSRFDSTAQYDMLVFRRLTERPSATKTHTQSEPSALALTGRRRLPPVLHRIDTVPLGLALFDRMLLTVHPANCPVLSEHAQRLQNLAATEGVEPRRSAPVRLLPSSAADLMLRLMGSVVDGYLDLRRELTRQLDHWQAELLDPRTRFNNWNSLLQARLALHQIEEITEDQRLAVLDWIGALQDWPAPTNETERTERDLLRVRSRDVLEHIERVVHHVRRLEHNAETTVQIHFSAQSHRANDIMRTLTVLTAIFLPLNLIAGIFGMNFEFIPLLHTRTGFWLALGGMGLVALSLGLFFWRKRYLDQGR